MSSSVPALVTFSVQNQAIVAQVQMAQIRDVGDAQSIADQVIAQADATAGVGIVFDLRHVTFIGSVGLLAFLRVRRERSQARIVLSQLSPTIKQFFTVCRLIPSQQNPMAPFELADTVEEAVAKLAS